MGFPRQEYWSGLPFHRPVDLLNPEIEPTSPALLADSLTLSHLGSPQWLKKKKNAPVMQKTGVRSLGQEDPLEKEIATHSIIPAWEIPWTEKPGRL